MKIKVLKLTNKAKAPTKRFKSDAGWDIYASNSYLIQPLSSKVINTGIKIEFPSNYRMRIAPKSKSDYLIGAGVIESTYQGEILVKVVNYQSVPIEIKEGDAVAQLLFDFLPEEEELEEVTEIHQVKSERGTTGGIVTQVSEVELVDDISEFENEHNFTPEN